MPTETSADTIKQSLLRTLSNSYPEHGYSMRTLLQLIDCPTSQYPLILSIIDELQAESRVLSSRYKGVQHYQLRQVT